VKAALVIVRDDTQPAPPAGPAADERAWVEAARAGDRGSFGRLYERYAAMVHGLLLAQVPYAEVEDLVQDVFVQAMRKLPGLRDPAAFAPWLGAIARNRAMDRHRGRKPAAAPPASEGAPASAEVEARAILAVIHQLPLAYRETLVLRLVEGMTGPEIATRTGLTPESVRVNLHRGMKKLRALLDQAPKGDVR
jgi:RNA polymerase sigma-70 factor (ECF subfamily)